MRVPQFATVLAVLVLAPQALAGMPTPVLTEVVKNYHLTESAEMRLQVVSFFLVVLLGSPLVVRWLWNSLRRDFPSLPRITYGRSVGLVTVWGLLFLVVLTMIAATREGMTPGSWEKQGLLYRVGDPAASAPGDPYSERQP